MGKLSHGKNNDLGVQPWLNSNSWNCPRLKFLRVAFLNHASPVYLFICLFVCFRITSTWKCLDIRNQLSSVQRSTRGTFRPPGWAPAHPQTAIPARGWAPFIAKRWPQILSPWPTQLSRSFQSWYQWTESKYPGNAGQLKGGRKWNSLCLCFLIWSHLPFPLSPLMNPVISARAMLHRICVNPGL